MDAATLIQEPSGPSSSSLLASSAVSQASAQAAATAAAAATQGSIQASSTQAASSSQVFAQVSAQGSAQGPAVQTSIQAYSTRGPAQASSPVPIFRTGRHKSCDACKARKVKCPNANYPAPCGNCVRRKTTCHFGTKKVPRRNVSAHLQLGRPCTTPGGALHDATLDAVSDVVHSPESSPLRYVDPPQPAKPGDAESEASGAHTPDASQTNVYGDNGITCVDVGTIPMLYIDHMLAQAQHQNLSKEYTPLTKGNGIFGGSYSLTFFSEGRLLSLSSRLRNNKVSELVHRINGVVVGRLRRTEPTTQESLMMPISPMASTGNGEGNGPPALLLVDPPFAAACIRCYFENVHSHYPFLDQASFERRAADPDLARSLSNSRAWSSLYHAVLAIGCLYTDGGGGIGSFEPGKGMAWRLFSVALGHFSELLILPDSLITLQALTAMAIYGLGVACLSIERVLLSEAARRAQSLAAASSTNSNGGGGGGGGGGSNNIGINGSGNIMGGGGTSTGVNPATTATFQRTFWVLYGIEKVMSFHFGRSSSFIDSDISCPLPDIPAVPLDGDDDGDGSDGSVGGGSVQEAQAHQPTPPQQQQQQQQQIQKPKQHLNWFLVWIRHARLLSRTYTSLFSVGTSCNSAASSLATIDQLAAEVEEWRCSIPDVRSLRPQTGPDAGQISHRRQRHRATAPGGRGGTRDFERSSTLALSFLYHSYALILARARLHHLSRLTGPQAMAPAQLHQQRATSEQVITSSCRAILELTPFIDVEPYTPLWILAVAPLSSLLVLFDFVIHHPTGPDAASNLVLLEMGAGYFSHIEYTSGGTLPGSLVSEFVHIARDYVNGQQHQHQPQHQHQHQHQQQGQQQHQHQQYGVNSNDSSDSPQQPLPIPPPPPSMTSPTMQNASTTSATQPLGLVDASALAAVDWSAVTAGSSGGVPGYSDGFGYGFMGTGTGADYSGTDVMGLFSYLLPEMDSMLYQGMGESGFDT